MVTMVPLSVVALRIGKTPDSARRLLTSRRLGTLKEGRWFVAEADVVELERELVAAPITTPSSRIR